MLGPALMVLLNELHNRKDRQTSYEKQLYAELLWLAAAAAAGLGWGWGCRRCCDRRRGRS
jgi:hypothetical protein